MLFKIFFKILALMMMLFNFGLNSEALEQKSAVSLNLKQFSSIEVSLDSSLEEEVLNGLKKLQGFFSRKKASELSQRDYRYIYQRIPSVISGKKLEIELLKELYLVWKKVYNSKFFQGERTWKDIFTFKRKKVWPVGSDSENFNNYKGLSVQYSSLLKKKCQKALEEIISSKENVDLKSFSFLKGLIRKNSDILSDKKDLLFNDLSDIFSDTYDFLVNFFNNNKKEFSKNFKKKLKVELITFSKVLSENLKHGPSLKRVNKLDNNLGILE